VIAEQEQQLLPARMVNEYVYCPRLFYYEHVEGVFAHNKDTVEGAIRHSRVDAKADELPPPEELVESESNGRARSVMLSSQAYGVVAKMDLVETTGSTAVPVDYKRGRPCKADDGTPEAWPSDRVQLAVQAIVLRENGYEVNEAIAYYAETKQRVRIAIDDALLAETTAAIEQARELAAGGEIPPPLDDSPKCPRCSLVGICLPDETKRCRPTSVGEQLVLFEIDTPPGASLDHRTGNDDVRRLVPARDDLRPLYLNHQGLHVGKSGQVLKVKEKGKVVQEVRINEVCQVNLFGNVQLTTQAIQELCQSETPIAYFSQGGWFYGITQGLGVKNIYLRREQFRWADIPSFCLRLARALVAGKIRNQRTMLQRNHIEPPRAALVQMRCMHDEALQAESLESLLGIEGNAARVYFQQFSGMVKVGDDTSEEVDAGGNGEKEDRPAGLRFDFEFAARNRRPPRDPVNALLSLAYSLLSKDLTVVCHAVGFDPYLGFYHQPRFGRAALPLDLMEPFRPLIADSAVLSAINTRMVQPSHFIRTGQAVALTSDGRKAFFRAYEQRMDSLVTHPIFGYRVSYRRMLEIQSRLLARTLTGEIPTYPVFVTR